MSLTLEAFEQLCKTSRGLGVRELARALGAGKSTMHRILQTLESHGYVRQDLETARYLVTVRPIEIASLIQSGLEFRQVARPFLSALQERCRETVFLGVLDGTEVVIVDRIDTPEPLRMVTDIGFREPAHSTALGKALLGGLPDEELEAVLSRIELKAFTPRTIRGPGDLRSELNRVRISGFAIDDEETLEGVRCVAAPIRDVSRSIIAAVSLSGPTVRIGPQRIPNLAHEVRTTAEMISRELGYSGEETAATLSDERLNSVGS